MPTTPEAVEEALAWADGHTCSDGRVHFSVILAYALRESRVELERYRKAEDRIEREREFHSMKARAEKAESELAAYREVCFQHAKDAVSLRDSLAKNKASLAAVTKAALEHECPGDGSIDQRCYMKRCSITTALAAPSTQEEP